MRTTKIMTWTTRFLILVVLRLPTFGSNFATLPQLLQLIWLGELRPSYIIHHMKYMHVYMHISMSHTSIYLKKDPTLEIWRLDALLLTGMMFLRVSKQLATLALQRASDWRLRILIGTSLALEDRPPRPHTSIIWRDKVKLWRKLCLLCHAIIQGSTIARLLRTGKILVGSEGGGGGGTKRERGAG